MLSEKRNVCLRLWKNQGFKDESITKGRSYAIGTSTTLESNKSQAGLGLLGGEHVQTPQDRDLPWCVDPRSPLCLSISENHGVDERSMRGMLPGSRAGTKLGI